MTANLSLIKPDVNERIEEALPTFAGWAAQNAINMDNIDALFRATTHSYSPSWTAATTNPTLGAGGSVTGKYLRLFPRMVIGHFLIFTGGAGFAAGSGFYNISAPVAMPTELLTFADSIPVGKAAFHDNSAVLTSTVFEIMCSVTTGNFFLKDPSGASWTDVSPVVPAQNDRLTGYFMYPTSAV